jgi:5-methylcytosine-specific restriction protein A
MPRKPLLPCRHPGCPRLSDQSYCEIHRRQNKSQADREYNKNRRNQELQAFYDSPQWRRMRAIKIKCTPYCEECYRQGSISEAKIVDHILPIKDCPDRRLDLTNLQSLCLSCHNKKHGKNKQGW